MKFSHIVLATALFALTPWHGAQAQNFQCSGNAPTSLLLVDQSDVFDPVDRQRVANGIAEMISVLPGGSKLDIFAITNRPGEMTPALQSCVPACGGPGQAECDDALYLRHRQAFNGQVQRVIAGFIQHAAPLDESEILRSLYWLSREYEGRNVTSVTIFSDLIEYSNLNKSISGFDRDAAVALLQTVRSRAAPGRAFAKASVKVFGFGKRLGSQSKEAAAIARREQIERIEETTSRKPGDRRLTKPKIETFELNDTSIKAFDYFWRRYFLELAGALDVAIKQTY